MARPKLTECSIDGCGKPVTGRGWCSMHWQRWRTHGDPLVRLREPENFISTDGVCIVPECDKPRKARGMCSTHHARLLRTGSTESRTRLKPPTACSVDDCDGQAETRGFCNKHYLRWCRYGDPLGSSLLPNRTWCPMPGCTRRVQRAGLCMPHHGIVRAELSLSQQYRCAICGTHEAELSDGRRGGLVLDHDHAARRPRGLLCHGCNVGIGHFKESPTLLHAAIAYLTTSS